MNRLAQFEGRTLDLLGGKLILSKAVFPFSKENLKKSNRFHLLLLERRTISYFSDLSPLAKDWNYASTSEKPDSEDRLARLPNRLLPLDEMLSFHLFNF